MSAPPLVTLTGNLLAERTQDFATWEPGRTQRAVSESFQVGGKGINVAKMLARLGSPATALCFTGGPAGAECAAWLGRQAFPSHTFPTTAPTRTGLVVRAPGRAETTFLGPDRAPDGTALAACARHLDTLPPETVAALSGSFPGWLSADTAPLRASLERLASAGRLVVDSYGPPLAWAVRQPCALVKINRAEYDEIFPADARNGSDLAKRLQAVLADHPVAAWIVTDGPGAVWLAARDTAPVSLLPPPVHEISATGSGDVLLACVLHALSARKMSLREAVAFALPYAAANAAHPGIAEFPLPE